MPETIAEDDEGLRLDRWLKRRFPELTNAMAQKLLRTGQIRVDGKRCAASDRLTTGQSVRLPPFLANPPKVSETETASRRPYAPDLKDLILYEDDDVVAINKPHGLAAQGGTGLKESVDDALMQLSRDGKTKPKLAHRLDRDTCGVLLLARTPYAAAKLGEAFRGRDARKTYLAVVLGIPSPPDGRIEAALAKQGEKMIVVEDDDERAQPATTGYHVIDTAMGKAALVELSPVTGKTHQLRVHMAHLGTPILGDRVYCDRKLVAMSGLPEDKMGKCLHLLARRIIVPHPRKGTLNISSPPSAAMAKTLQTLGFTKHLEDF